MQHRKNTPNFPIPSEQTFFTQQESFCFNVSQHSLSVQGVSCCVMLPLVSHLKQMQLSHLCMPCYAQQLRNRQMHIYSQVQTPFFPLPPATANTALMWVVASAAGCLTVVMVWNIPQKPRWNWKAPLTAREMQSTPPSSQQLDTGGGSLKLTGACNSGCVYVCVCVSSKAPVYLDRLRLHHASPSNRTWRHRRRPREICGSAQNTCWVDENNTTNKWNLQLRSIIVTLGA